MQNTKSLLTFALFYKLIRRKIMEGLDFGTEAILDENEKVMDRINVMKDKMPEVVNVIKKRVEELKAKGGCRQNGLG